MRLPLLAATCLAVIGAPAASAFPRHDDSPPTPDLSRLTWRGIGPVNMGGRIVDLAARPDRPSTFYVATATGGLWRTTTNGAAFRPLFDDQTTGSIGAVAIAPSQPDTVWAGTGEANPRNSASWGDGIYVSDDGGDTWSHKGLRDTRHIGGIAVHPTNPDVVFVAAMGHTWGPNDERGLYRSTDAGESWEKVLFVDDQTGCMEVLIDPTRPELVYATTWTRQRDTFDGGDPVIQTGEGSGLWKSTDGGTTWARLNNGLPTRPMGRIGLDIWATNPDVLYAVVQTDLTGRAAPGGGVGRPRLGVQGAAVEATEGRAAGYKISRVFEATGAENAGLVADDIILSIADRSTDTREALTQAIGQYKPGETVSMSVRRGDETLAVDVTFGSRDTNSDQGFGRGMQGGQEANRQDAQGTNGFETGGVFRSDDAGESWKRVNSLNPRPFYYSQIRIAPSDDQRIWVLGISFHSSTDGGASFTTRRGANTHPDHHALWVDPRDPEHLILGNDGGLYVTWNSGRSWDHHDHLPLAQFYNISVDMRSPYWVYGGLQDNGSWGGPSASTDRRGITKHDWFKIGGGDGFHTAVDPRDPAIVFSESQNGAIQRKDLRTNQTQRARAAYRTRFNWNTPFVLSPHDPDVLWFAGGAVFRSSDQGRSSESISEEIDITRTSRGSATALCESPTQQGFVLVGTDDGNLWATQNSGGLWARVSDNFVDVPDAYYVSDVEASHHAAGTVYATLDGHRHDDYRPYVFRSEDFGYTWQALHMNLPEGSVRCIEEDAVNPNLLFVGTEFGCFASLDRGTTWSELSGGLPTVPVHDLVIHPRDQELVAGTHGRGIWIVDISALRQCAVDALAGTSSLFTPRPAIRWNGVSQTQQFSASIRDFVAADPQSGAAIHCYLDSAREGATDLQIEDASGKVLTPLEGPKERGLHRVVWNLRERGGRRGAGSLVAPGEYVVRWTVGDVEHTAPVVVRPDPRGGGGFALPADEGER